jgi:hypothetical protein
MSLLVLFSAPEKRTRMGSGGIPQREALLRYVYAGSSASTASVGVKKAGMNPAFDLLARLFGRETSKIIQASFTPQLGIFKLMV